MPEIFPSEPACEPAWRAVLALGSNLGDRAANLLRALTHLRAAGIEILQCSDIYETEPRDYLDQPAFLNMAVLAGGAALPAPVELLRRGLAVETQLGRTRLIDKGPRTIDIDLLLYGDQVLESAGPPALSLPHPRLHERGFVLVPLAELIPDVRHPVYQRTFSELRERVADLGGVVRYRA